MFNNYFSELHGTDWPAIVTAFVARRIKEDKKQISKQKLCFDLLDISVDEEKPDQFGFVVRTHDGKNLTLRRAVESLPDLGCFPLFRLVDSVTLVRGAAFSCSPKEFYEHVIQYYDGHPHLWPDHNIVKAEFMGMPHLEQLNLMARLADYYYSKFDEPNSILDFLRKNRKSLGTIELNLRSEPLEEAKNLSSRAITDIRTSCGQLVEALREASPDNFLSYLKEDLISIYKFDENLLYKSDFAHQIWLLGGTNEETSKFGFLNQMSLFERSLERLQDSLKHEAKEKEPRVTVSQLASINSKIVELERRIKRFRLLGW